MSHDAMTNGTRSALPADPHRECWDLLPWFITGRLDPAQRASVESHLEGCKDCREELSSQRDLRDALAREDTVAYSPAASFEGLWSRIEELERELPPVDTTQTQTDTRAVSSRSRPWRPSSVSRWLVAAVVVQAIGLAWVAGVLVSDRTTTDWPFQTVTSPVTGDASMPRYRVVFARDITLEGVQQVLDEHGLAIVRGSAASDVFTLAAPAERAELEPGDVLDRLRNDSRVRFAELEPQARPQ
jgi:anti-sigma factor RsiW